MLLHDLVIQTAKWGGSRAAIRQRDRVESYDRLAQQMAQVAIGLINLGLRPDDRVGVYSSKRIEVVDAFFGISLAGGIFIPINPSLKRKQITHILRDSGARILIADETWAAKNSEYVFERTSVSTVLSATNGDELYVRSKESGAKLVNWSGLPEGEKIKYPIRLDTDVAAIYYTSGSTGPAKGVMTSHRNLVSGAKVVSHYLKNSPDDVLLAVLPLSFDAGFSQLTTAFLSGASVVLIDYLTSQDTINAVERYSITGIAGVPQTWIHLARQQWPAGAMSSVRYITNTGGAMPQGTLSILRKRLPETDIYLMYGLTEAFRSTYLSPQDLDERPSSVGKAVGSEQVFVINEHGEICGPDEPGELVHCGDLVSLGYWNDPAATAKRFRPLPAAVSPNQENAVWSGDIFVADKDGYLYFVGRNDDMIKSSGYRISPTEIEDVVYTDDRVKECAAIGISHAELGQAILVIYSTEGWSTDLEGDLHARCETDLPRFMIPKQFCSQLELPHNANGKIDRQTLRDQYNEFFLGE